MRIFIGLREIANIGATLTKGFHTLGHETYTVMLRKNRYYSDNKYDNVIEENIPSTGPHAGGLEKIRHHLLRQKTLTQEFYKGINSCDIFIFIFASSFLPGFIDYPILKLFKKKIVSVFCGSDIRYWYAYNQEFKSLGLLEGIQSRLENAELDSTGRDNYFRKLKRVRVAERYSDLILSQPIMAQLQVRPYMRLNIPLDISQYRWKVFARDKPVILHAPTHRDYKGTKYVLEATELLKREGIEFDFRLLEGMPNSEIRDQLRDADIVIDQLLGQTVATLALEAMASGNVVFARYLPQRLRIPLECPVVNVTEHTLADHLRRIILDVDLRKRIAYAGRAYVEKYHSHIKVTQEILDWLKPDGIVKYDFVPTFFQNELDISDDILYEERKMLWKSRMQRIRNIFTQLSMKR